MSEHPEGHSLEDLPIGAHNNHFDIAEFAQEPQGKV